MDKQTEKDLKSILWHKHRRGWLSDGELQSLLHTINTLQGTLGQPHMMPQEKPKDFWGKVFGSEK